mmetsp:Transcript_19668/g.39106  ORF Transcript_19668/g.39106 Transcript_19668/m.39106 type:complete len:238 (-) Transcript_19668:19-732(-)
MQSSFYYGGPANVISLSKLQRKYRINVDSWGGNRFIVQKPNRKMIVFKQHPCGLYYHDIVKRTMSTPTDDASKVQKRYEDRLQKTDVLTFGGAYKKTLAFITTVAGQMILFTHRQIRRTKEARRAYGIVGTPSPAYFKSTVRGQSIKKSPCYQQGHRRRSKYFLHRRFILQKQDNLEQSVAGDVGHCGYPKGDLELTQECGSDGGCDFHQQVGVYYDAFGSCVLQQYRTFGLRSGVP